MYNSNTEIIKLGPRLHTIASYVPQGALLGDIGTDHAYLPVYLTQKGIIKHAIGVDIHKGPYDSALETVRNYGLKERIEVRLGNGLAPLKAREVDTLTIAGMGGTTILEILRSNPGVIEQVNNLILQPQGAEARVRRELLTEGWRMIDECLVEEDGRVYTVIPVSRLHGFSITDIEVKVYDLAKEYYELIKTQRSIGSNEEERSRLDSKDLDTTKDLDTKDLINKIIWQLGPLILTKKDKLLGSILHEAILSQHKVIHEMSKTDREDVKLQAERLRREIDIMEVVGRWLSQ